MKINGPFWTWLSFFLALSANLWIVHYSLQEQLSNIGLRLESIEDKLPY